MNFQMFKLDLEKAQEPEINCQHPLNHQKSKRVPEKHLRFSLVQFSHSVMSDSLRPHESQHARPPFPSPTPGVYSNSFPSSQWCHPAISSSVVPFSSCNESTLRMRWPKYWSFSFRLSPSNEHPGLISFRMDWLDLLAVQGTLKSLLQHRSSKASIFRCSAFFWQPLVYFLCLQILLLWTFHINGIV